MRRRANARGRTDSTVVAAGAPVWMLGVAENVEIIRRIGGRAKDLKVTFSSARRPRGQRGRVGRPADAVRGRTRTRSSRTSASARGCAGRKSRTRRSSSSITSSRSPTPTRRRCSTRARKVARWRLRRPGNVWSLSFRRRCSSTTVRRTASRSGSATRAPLTVAVTGAGGHPAPHARAARRQAGDGAAQRAGVPERATTPGRTC